MFDYPFAPRYADLDAARDILAELSRGPPLVQEVDARSLKRAIAACAAGERFFFHAGHCAERFQDASVEPARRMIELLLTNARRFHPDACVVGRMAGQFAKPRSDYGYRDQDALPTYSGDLYNGVEATAGSRVHDPWRMVRAARAGREALEAIREANLWSSHEALHLDYERALVRDRHASSAHFLWIGDRTRDPQGAHVRFAASVDNPLGVKLGPTTTESDVVALIGALNPMGESGRLTFILRLGGSEVETRLPALLRADPSRSAMWICDPMHGNTRRTSDGLKTRDLEAIVYEWQRCVDIFARERRVLAGIHLEVAVDDVTECVGADVTERDVHRRYETACDPRLNPTQLEELAARVAMPRVWATRSA